MGSTDATIEKPTVAADEEKVETENELVPEEEVLEGDWMRPQVDLKEVEVKSGEEDEETFWKHRAKLYRWAKEAGEWKERGLGEAKLLKHKQSGKTRFLLRQEKTLKIVANHYVVAHHKFCQLTPNVSSDKIWVWTVTDFADNNPKVEQFGLRFGQVEAATEFKKKFEEAAEINRIPFKDVLTKAAEQDDKTKE